MSEKIRVDKLFANLGYGSRKEANLAVKNGWISLRGVVVKDSGFQVSLADVRNGDLTIDDKPFDPVAPLTVMLNKPQNYTCSHEEQGLIVFDLLPERWAQRNPVLSCAGRLDKDSTGMVILTDDGDLLHKIIHPRTHAEKYYAVTLANPLKGDEAAQFATGEFLLRNDTKPLKPARWIPDTDKSGTMILTEGRYHQIRRMFAAVGNKVETLHRFQTGGLDLGGLKSGAYRILSADDLEKIFSKS